MYKFHISGLLNKKDVNKFVTMTLITTAKSLELLCVWIALQDSWSMW